MVQSSNKLARRSVAAQRLYRSRYLYLMLIPVLAYFGVFHYAPMYGAVIAFKNFNPFLGIMGSPWVGFKYFQQFFESIYFSRLVRNTLTISLLSIALGFPMPILLALMMNELRSARCKRVVQTVVYLPHFVSVVVVAGMILSFLSVRSGVVNTLIKNLGGTPISFMSTPGWFPWIYAISGVWQEAGWGSIIYLAAITGIDPGLHEAAVIDGATRFQRILHVTLPGILPTIVIMFILRMGSVFSVGFEKVMLLYNARIYETADVISTYVYRRGIQGMEFSFSTAVGLFNSVINLTVLVLFNQLSRRVGQTSLW